MSKPDRLSSRYHLSMKIINIYGYQHIINDFVSVIYEIRNKWRTKKVRKRTKYEKQIPQCLTSYVTSITNIIMPYFRPISIQLYVIH